MNKEHTATLDLFDANIGGTNQFRLTRIQTFNWGTFQGVFNFPIAEHGYLFVGPSGSGKSNSPGCTCRIDDTS